MKTSDVVIVMGSHRKEGNTAYWTGNLTRQLERLGHAYTYLDVIRIGKIIENEVKSVEG